MARISKSTQIKKPLSHWAEIPPKRQSRFSSPPFHSNPPFPPRNPATLAKRSWIPGALTGIAGPWGLRGAAHSTHLAGPRGAAVAAGSASVAGAIFGVPAEINSRAEGWATGKVKQLGVGFWKVFFDLKQLRCTETLCSKLLWCIPYASFLHVVPLLACSFWPSSLGDLGSCSFEKPDKHLTRSMPEYFLVARTTNRAKNYLRATSESKRTRCVGFFSRKNKSKGPEKLTLRLKTCWSSQKKTPGKGHKVNTGSVQNEPCLKALTCFTISIYIY